MSVTYPKPVMRKAELVKLGYPEEWLMDAYNDKTQDFAWKIDPTKSNSPIIYDTDGLEKYRQKTIDLQSQMRRRGRMVM